MGNFRYQCLNFIIVQRKECVNQFIVFGVSDCCFWLNWVTWHIAHREHSRSFGTEHISSFCLRPQRVVWHIGYHSVQFVCHGSEKMGSTRDSVCMSLYVAPFDPHESEEKCATNERRESNWRLSETGLLRAQRNKPPSQITSCPY